MSAKANATVDPELPIKSSLIGPAFSGYKRTLYLSTQVDLCNANSEVDYFLLTRPPKELHLPPLQSGVFRKYRNLAMTTGNTDAIGAVAHHIIRVGLISWTRQPTSGNPPDDPAPEKVSLEGSEGATLAILEQLGKEYEIDITESVAREDPENRTRVEIEAAEGN